MSALGVLAAIGFLVGLRIYVDMHRRMKQLRDWDKIARAQGWEPKDEECK